MGISVIQNKNNSFSFFIPTFRQTRTYCKYNANIMLGRNTTIWAI